MTDMQLASAGDHGAFERLFAAEVPKLRGLIRKMIGHPEEVEDLVQDTLVRAFEKIGTFSGASSPGTWLCSIGTRLAIDHLRRQKRWRERAQVTFAARALGDPVVSERVSATMAQPDTRFDVKEHIAYCFTCVGRTLEPEAQAALMLRDVLQLSNAEAAKAVGTSQSVLRHHLAAGRQQMQAAFEGLCSLVNKQGVCWQCKGLREVMPESKRAGEPPPDTLSWEARLEVVREAPAEGRVARALHDLFFVETCRQEAEGLGADDAQTDCGRPGTP